MTMLPLRYLGEGQFQTPPGFAARADRELVIGEVLRWEIAHDRSQRSHAHYFAVISDAWSSLPEHMANDLPSPEHLRKYALIKAGYCTIKKIVCASNSEAITACSLFAGLDSFAVCDVTDNVVTVYRANSQSIRAMGAKDFQESKEAVLTVISQIIGADATKAGQAAWG